MYKCLIAAIVILVFWGTFVNGHAQDFPEGEYKYLPDQSTIIIEPTKDFEKLRDFSKESDVYTLSRKVACIKLDSGGSCTGFLVGPNLLLTNHHCVYRIINRREGIPYKDQTFKQRRLQAFKVYMEYYEDDNKGPVSAGVKALVKANAALDYALLRLDKPLGDTYGWLELSETLPKKGSSVRIIQHPRGRSKEIVRKHTEIVKVFDDMLHYVADTEKGSSGSPVFPMEGDGVIALHHVGNDKRNVNEGVLMIKIVPEIQKWLPAEEEKPSTVASPDSTDSAAENDRLHAVYNFLETYVIGNTLTHQDYIPAEDENGEIEVVHRKSYTNLTQGDKELSFDVFSVITHSHYQLDPDGMRLQETRSPLQRDIALTRYTVDRSLNTDLLYGVARCLSHTSAELIGETSTLQLRFEEATLTLIVSAPLSHESTDQENVFLPGGQVRIQEFRVEGAGILSRSRSANLSWNAETLVLTPQDEEGAPVVWRVEGSRSQTSEFVDIVPKSISDREDFLLAETGKGTDTVLIRVDEFLYPGKIEGGLLESFPLQANVRTYHHDDNLRTFFYELLLPSEVESNLHTLEVFENAEWVPVRSFQWKDGQFLEKSDTTSELKSYPFDHIRFRVDTPQPPDEKPETD